MKYIGSYTTEFKNILTASAVSGQNCVTISAPGWGKTEMALQTAWDIYTPEQTVFVEIDPSTPPEVVRGAYDPAAMLQGQLSRRLEGTPYDPSAKVVVLDELWRGNDVLFDALVHATSMKTRAPKDRPVFWATSNFVGKAERTEALRDRFAIWYWMDGQLDVRGMTQAHLTNGTGYDPDWKKDLPTAEQVAEIRNAQPGPKAQAAIIHTIETLAAEANASGFTVNPRRISQWTALLFGYGMYISGSDDFVTIPDQASRMLKYCYPSADRKTSASWAQVAVSIVDQVGAAIEAFKASAIEKFRAVAGIKDPGERTGKIIELGQVLAEAQTTLKQIGGDDPRAAEAVSEMTDWFAKAARGETL